MSKGENMTGMLLVAHPMLRDPNFRRTVLFLSHHSEEEGATGFVINRPLRENLSNLLGVPPVQVFYGGPVETRNIQLASLQWRENPTMVAFRMFIKQPEPQIIESEWQPGLRAFAGYAGWTRGQLESEISQNAWIVIPPTPELIHMENPKNAWKNIMRQAGPILRLLAEAPDTPHNN